MKKSIYIGSFIVITIIILISITITKRLSKADLQVYYEIAENKNDSLLRIGIIGDSWASLALQYNFDKYIDSSLYCHNIKSKTYIKGEPGAKTKSIYLNMFSEAPLFSTKHIIQTNPQYCIILGGINDLHGQYGQEYYKHHLLLIVETLLHYHIKPIIIEIPFFYNQKQYEMYSLAKQTGYKFLSLITSRNIHTENCDRYRNAIVNSLSSKSLLDKVIYISTDSILKNNKHLYIDNMHINEQGYYQLGNVIVQQLTNNINQNK